MKKTIKNSITLLIALFIIMTNLASYIYANTNTDNNATNINAIENLEIVSQPNIQTRATTAEPPYEADSSLGGRTYFIKNAYTGQYLDVQDGIGANGSNVWQYKFNGSQAQQWYVHSYGNGDYTLFTPVGNDGTSYVYALDISDGSGNNNANAQIWQYNGSDAQKFCLAKVTYGGAYIMYSKCSDYSKSVVLSSSSCQQGTNVNQYTFQSYSKDLWILEPIARDDTKGVWYAKYNYNKYVDAYPNLTTFNQETVNCANFVSQCLLASGMHFQDDWMVYRKNGNYSKPLNVDQLNNTWELADPSPWISAKYFYQYWRDRKNIHVYTGQDILNNPQQILNEQVGMGDVVQYGSTVDYLLSGMAHTMYITGYGTYNGNNSYTLTYQSNEALDKNLLEICAAVPSCIFVFYEM